MRYRNNAFIIRLSDDEASKLNDRLKKTGQTRQSFLINAILHSRISSREEIEELRQQNAVLQDIDNQLRGMAVNINQVARYANASRALPAEEVLFDILADVQTMRRKVDESWRSTRQLIAETVLTKPSVMS